MKPKRIILIRHGESVGNIDKSQYESTPDFALKLTPAGIDQAKQAGIKLKEIIGEETVCAYLSPLFRTRETFHYLREALNRNISRSIEDPRIREQDWGHLKNLESNKDINQERDNFSTFYYRIPDGESGADVYDRVSSFLDTLHRDFEKDNYPANALIVSHGLTSRLFLMRWFHWTVEEFENLRNPKNCQIIVMEKQENNYYKLISELFRRENV